MQKEFLDIVKSDRDVKESIIRDVSDGRILTGREAKNLKLIDALGNEKDALAWLKKEAGVAITRTSTSISSAPAHGVSAAGRVVQHESR